MALAIDPKDNQQVFDFCLRKIREQGKPSMDASGTCAYRGEDGLRCVAGWLIPNEDYIPRMEGVQVASGGRIRKYFEQKGFDLLLLEGIQNSHDNNSESPMFMQNFNEDMMQVAQQFQLSYS